MENAMKMKDSDRKKTDAVLTGDRRSFLRASLLAGGALAARSLSRRTSFVAAESNSLLATTKAGMVRGAVEDGIIVFKGVPYGAPPTGALRFMPPVPPAPWTGVRDALQFGDRCPQVSAPSSPAWRSWDRQTGESEDCLVLNVWTPALRDGRRRPVMVWFHGGGFTSGSGSDTVYDGARLCQRGDVVLVTLNHRLNAFGYLYLAEFGGEKFSDSGNVGQLDLVLALKWVRDNITEFGGDPNNVMIFGESGGGGKVSVTLAMPAAKGLFHRAAIQSCLGLRGMTRETATKTAKDFMAALQLQPDQVEELQKLPVRKLLDAVQAVTQGMPGGFEPVVDGRVLPRDSFTPDAPTVSANVPIIVGYTKTEATIVILSYDRGQSTALLPAPNAFSLNWTTLPQALTPILGGYTEKVLALCRREYPQASASDLYFRIATERSIGLASMALAERKSEQGRAPVFLYRLEWETPIDGGRLRSPHSLDLPMVFDNVAKSDSLIGAGAMEAQKVADAMSSVWIAFAQTGRPDAKGLPHWPPYDTKTRSTMIFNVTSKVVNDPDSELHTLLKSTCGRGAQPIFTCDDLK
jgi:para-nitrobenzyl esterase